MIVWIDAQLSPALAGWLRRSFGVGAFALRDLGLRDAADREIFAQARRADAIVITKDSDFSRLLDEQGPPPRVVWLTCGNTTTAGVQAILQVH